MKAFPLSLSLHLIYLFLLLAAMPSPALTETYEEFLKSIYEDQKFTVDRSAASICYVTKGKLELVNPKNPDYGYTCDVELKAQTVSEEHARDMCESTFPHYIIEAEPKGSIGTRCKFIILFKCLDNYYSIYEKCYTTFDRPLSYQESKTICSTTQGNKTDAKLAEYTTSTLSIDLVHMNFVDAWMQVPNMDEFFSNQQEEGGAVFVIESSWQFDTKEGSLHLRDPSSLHVPLCEYSPPKTMAYTSWILDKYNNGVEGFPKFTQSPKGVTIGMADLCAPRDPDCMIRMREAFINIFEVPFPTFPRPPTLNHPFPTDLAFEFPQFIYGPCPDGWVKHVRVNGQHICHKLVKFSGEATDVQCHAYGAHFSGFDSLDEIRTMLDMFGWNYGIIAMGGVCPCPHVGCEAKPKNPRLGIDYFNCGWAHGIASELNVLYDNMRDAYLPDRSKEEWSRTIVDLLVSSWTKKIDFWTWDWSGLDAFACGKYADLIRLN